MMKREYWDEKVQNYKKKEKKPSKVKSVDFKHQKDQMMSTANVQYLLKHPEGQKGSMQ